MISELCLSPLSVWSPGALTSPLPGLIPKETPGCTTGSRQEDERMAEPQQFLTRDFPGKGWVGRARPENPAGNAQSPSGNGRSPVEKNPLKHEVDFEVSVYCILFRFPKQTGTRRHWFQYRFKHMQHWCPICTLISKAAQGPLHWKHTTTHTHVHGFLLASVPRKKNNWNFTGETKLQHCKRIWETPLAVLNCFLTSKLTFFFFPPTIWSWTGCCSSGCSVRNGSKQSKVYSTGDKTYIPIKNPAGCRWSITWRCWRSKQKTEKTEAQRDQKTH